MADINILYIGVLAVALLLRLIIMPGSNFLPSLKEGNLNVLGTLIIGLGIGYGILESFGDTLAVASIGTAIAVFFAIYGSPTLFDRLLTITSPNGQEQPVEKEPAVEPPTDDDDTA